MTNRLLLVEPSATMRYVLDKHAQSLGFAVDTTDSYTTAIESLARQYQQFGTEYSCMLFGWPSTPQNEAAELATVLEQADYKDLPVVVMSTDMRAETRAWVAGRDNTAVLSWKEYQGLETLLQRLIESTPEETGAFPAKFDNSDIHLLVVDDSATIRYSLRDLFQMQGYRVSLASTQDEAMQLAVKTEFDIAVLDFYLTETTGDLLCRELMSSTDTGDIVCTVLTGTYSDHIIKRSLRAGAVECMFKNESSELLLSRIDAISRFVRQKRILQNERALLEEVIESVAGAILILDSDKRISYVSESALSELELDSAVGLIGQSSDTILNAGSTLNKGTNLYSSSWALPNGKAIDVDYEHVLIERTGRSLVRFARKQISIDRTTENKLLVADEYESVESVIVQHLGLSDSSRPLLTQLRQYLDKAAEITERVSLFVLDVHVLNEQNERIPVSASKDIEKKVSNALHAIYRRSGHVALMKDGRYAFLLRHREEAHGYLLVRKIMQLCLEIDHGLERLQLTCSGSLLSVNNNSGQSISALVQHAFKGVDLVNSRAPNQTLLLDLRRMITAYPVEAAAVKSAD